MIPGKGSSILNVKTKPVIIPQIVWPYIAVLLLIILGAIISPGFVDIGHLFLILNLAVFLGLTAAGQNLVILTGGIDLSVGAVVALANVVSAALMNGSNDKILLAGAMSISFGILIGLVNGVGVAYLRIHPMVMTLGMTSIVQGMSLLYTNGSPKGNSAPNLCTIATGRMFGLIPNSLFIWAAVAVIIIIMLHKSVWGRWLFAVGNSEKAARYSGVNVKWMLISVYLLCSVLAALSGFLLTGYTRTSYISVGDSYAMDSVTAVVIGGTSILGGSGSYVGTIAGCIIVILIQSILPIISVPDAGRRIISGLLILFLLMLYGRERKLRK